MAVPQSSWWLKVCAYLLHVLVTGGSFSISKGRSRRTFLLATALVVELYKRISREFRGSLQIGRRIEFSFVQIPNGSLVRPIQDSETDKPDPEISN